MTAFGIIIVLIVAVLLWRNRNKSRIVSEDTETLVSHTLRLSGRPDRIILRADGHRIAVEKKNSARVQDSHRAQLGAYFLLIEDVYGKRPPHGFIALEDDREIKVKNSNALRSQVLNLMTELRNDTGKATPFKAKCRRCGMKDSCGFRIE